MSDPSADPVLHAPDISQPQSDALNDEIQALYKELAKYYDNPDSFFDPNVPFVHTMRVVRAEMPDRPDVLRIETEGRQLLLHLREQFLSMMKHTAEGQLIEDYQVSDWNEAREAIIADNEYLEMERQMYWIFARNMPNLLIKLYNILLLMSVISAVKKSLDEPARRESEPIVKKEITTAVRGLRNEIARMLETRSPGRPTKLPTGPLPDVVVEVLDIPRDIMGDARGNGAAPGLDAIALKLDTNADALGLRLRRAGHSWTKLRTFLENRPADDPT